MDAGNCPTLMVRSAPSRVSNHAAGLVPLILRDARKRGLLRMRETMRDIPRDREPTADFVRYVGFAE